MPKKLSHLVRRVLDEIVELWDTNELAPHPQADPDRSYRAFVALKELIEEDDAAEE
jgi:hypothetical protein